MKDDKTVLILGALGAVAAWFVYKNNKDKRDNPSQTPFEQADAVRAVVDAPSAISNEQANTIAQNMRMLMADYWLYLDYDAFAAQSGKIPDYSGAAKVNYYFGILKTTLSEGNLTYWIEKQPTFFKQRIRPHFYGAIAF